MVRKIRYFEKSGVTKITVSDRGEGNDFWFELSGGSKNRDSTVVISAETLHTLCSPSAEEVAWLTYGEETKLV